MMLILSVIYYYLLVIFMQQAICQSSITLLSEQETKPRAMWIQVEYHQIEKRSQSLLFTFLWISYRAAIHSFLMGATLYAGFSALPT